MRILIIGGTRFMGPLVVRQLAALGHEITVFHRGTAAIELPETVNELLGDRNRLGEFAGEFKELRPDVVLDMILLTEIQARELVEVMSGIAKRLVVVSSCDVYKQYGLLRGIESGPAAVGKLTESAPLREKYYPYREMVSGKSDILYYYDKILVEKLVMSDPNLPATVLRLPMVYGPGDYQHRFLGYIKRMIDGRPAILLNELQAEWRITTGFSEDCAGAICRAILNEEANGRIYNVSERSAKPEKEWVAEIAGIIGWSGKTVCLPEERLPKHLRSGMYWQYHLEVDTARIRKELGYTESVDRTQALKRTIDWEKANQPEQTGDDLNYPAEDRALAEIETNNHQ